MTKGQHLYNLLVVELLMNYPHLNDMTVSDARQNAYNNDNYVLNGILNVMLMSYPKYANKTFRQLQSMAQNMYYKESKKKDKI